MARRSSPADPQLANEPPAALPNAPLPVDSKFYIDRPPIEQTLAYQLEQPGSLLRIKAPRRMGKTSLVFRLIHHAQQLGYATAVIDFQQADPATLSDLNDLLLWLCSSLQHQLSITADPATCWRPHLGSKLNCTFYLQDEVLRLFDAPVVLFLRQVDALFAYPDVAKEFFPLLRGWFEDARWQDPWPQLRLVLTHSTDLYLPLKLHQSPFNVGFSVQLPGFTLPQVQVLADRYGLSDFTADQAQQLTTLVGGHPFLCAIALYTLTTTTDSLDQVLAQASSPRGIYGGHLRDYTAMLESNPALLNALRQIADIPEGRVLEPTLAYQLESAGLAKLQGDRTVISCDLYQRYFSSASSLAVAQFTPERVAPESLSMLHQRLRIVERDTQDLQQQFTVDEITGCVKRQPFQAYLAQRWQSADPQPFTLMLCSVDYFAVYVEAHGSDRGNTCLGLVADIIRHTVEQPAENLSRHSVEEFLVCLDRTAPETAQLLAHQICAQVEALQIYHAPQYLGLPMPVITVSMGLAAVDPRTTSLRQALTQVDQALQAAIRHGHNQVQLAIAPAEKLA